MKSDKNIFKKFLKLIENAMNLRTAKGYSASHPHKVVKPKPGLGKSEYEDENYKLFNATEYSGKIVKVIVKKKTNQKSFEKFIDKLYAVGVQELKIIENFSIEESENFEVEETENTISILNRYIDESEIECDKSIIKGILQKIYSQACEVE